MDITIIQQGRFTSDGTAQTLQIRSDLDWMEVINYTQSATTQTTGRGVMFRWQRGMSDGTGVMFTKQDSANALDLETLSTGGFTLVDSSTAGLGPVVTGTTITKADPPVCTAAGHGYSNGDLVQLSNLTNMPQLSQVVWTIGNVTTNTFELTYMDTNTANFTAETAFEVRKVPPSFFNPEPSGRSIANIVSSGTSTVVTLPTSLDSFDVSVGAVMRLVVPAVFGMTEIDGMTGTVTAVSTANNTVTLDIDSSSFTAFAWPASTAVPFTLAQAITIGASGSAAVDPADNVGYLGMVLGAGADGPAGSSSDVIYWRAGKSFSVSNS